MWLFVGQMEIWMCEVLSEIQHLLNISVIFGSEKNRRDHWQLAIALVKHTLSATIDSGQLKPFWNTSNQLKWNKNIIFISFTFSWSNQSKCNIVWWHVVKNNLSCYYKWVKMYFRIVITVQWGKRTILQLTAFLCD